MICAHINNIGPQPVQNSPKTKVLIVDDALSIRLFLKQLLSLEPDLEVICTAKDPIEAIEMLRTLNPDVITLDVEMPNMDGLTFLEKIMRLKPTPVVMLSTLTAKGSETALKALELGAVDIVAKPTAFGAHMDTIGAELLAKVRAAACARVGKRAAPKHLQEKAHIPPPSAEGLYTINDFTPAPIAPKGERPPLIAIGASTGGTEALRAVLSNLPTHLPPIVIVQHMPAGFVTPFATRLNSYAQLSVQEAVDNTPLLAGHAYIAPADCHLSISWNGKTYTQKIISAQRVNRHKPSVDVLFRSVAAAAGPAATGVLLTGMGDDGALGLKDIRTLGGDTITQDEATCVVYGMPRVAVSLGASAAQLPLQDIAKTLTKKWSTS